MVKGDRIKQLREAKGFTQQDLADRLHVNRSMVAKYEASTSMALQTLLDVCRVLGTSPNYLLGFTDTNETTTDPARVADATLERNLLAILSDQMKYMTEQLRSKEEELKDYKSAAATKKVHQ